MPKATSKPRRDARYQAAVRRQIDMVDAYNNADPKQRMNMARPAPVEHFLRPGDTADMFRDDTNEVTA